MSSILGYWSINANHPPGIARYWGDGTARYWGERSVTRVMSVVARVMPAMAGTPAAAALGKFRPRYARLILHGPRSPWADPRHGRVLATRPHAPWHDRGSRASPPPWLTPRAELRA